MEQITFSIIKPDAVKRNLIGNIISRFEKKKLTVIGAKVAVITSAQAEELYIEHINHPMFHNLIEYLTSGPSMFLLLKGKNAVKRVRLLLGFANPHDAKKGTIRGDLGISFIENSSHGTDKVANVERETAIFFPELLDLI